MVSIVVLRVVVEVKHLLRFQLRQYVVVMPDPRSDGKPPSIVHG
jgi:hypothetical protein